MPKHSRKRDLELSMPGPQAKWPSTPLQAKQGAHVQLLAKERVHVNRPNQATQQAKQGLTFQQVRHHLLLKMQFLEN